MALTKTNKPKGRTVITTEELKEKLERAREISQPIVDRINAELPKMLRTDEMDEHQVMQWLYTRWAGEFEKLSPEDRECLAAGDAMLQSLTTMGKSRQLVGLALAIAHDRFCPFHDKAEND